MVTFALPGFSTVVRQGIELTGAATVQVNGDLRVGALEETLTVTGEAPVVDVQSVRREFVVNKDMMETLPVGRSLTAQIVLIARRDRGRTRQAACSRRFMGRRRARPTCTTTACARAST